MRQRNLLAVFLLTIVTCGIYGIYLTIAMPNEYAGELGESRNVVLDVILLIFTCGIYGIYLDYLTGVYINRVADSRNEPTDDISVLSIILTLCGGGFLVMILLQEKMNAFVTMGSNTNNENF